MRCPKCHETDHASDAIFCHMCGERLKRTNPLAIILPILGVLTFIIIIICLFNSSGSQSHVSPGYVVPAEPVRTGNNSVTGNYFDEGNNTNQQTITKITINGEDVSDTYLSGGNSVVIIDNNLHFTNNNSVNRFFAITNRYTQLNIENAFEVYVSDTASRITISSNENAMPEVVEAEGGNKLIIRNKLFNSNHALKGRSIKIDLSGSSNLNCNIEANELNLHLEGSSEANLSGRVGIINIKLGGSSSLTSRIAGNGYTLACDNCNGSMSGSSEAYIHCERSISVNLSGASDLHYSGNADISGSFTSGSSEILSY